MIEGIAFSAKGDRVSDFEVALVEQLLVKERSLLGGLACRLVAEFGPRAGAQALAAVLDELGSEYVYLKQRGQCFRGLWRDQRDQLIHDLAADGRSCGEIAAMLGMTRSGVHKRLRRVPVGGTGNGAAGKTQA